MYTKVKTLIYTNKQIKRLYIEANIYRGMFAFYVLGVSTKYEKKIREKVNSIFKLYNRRLPNKKIVFNIPEIKEKYDYDLLDLPIFVALLKILNIKNFEDNFFIGSLGLKGDLNPLTYPYRLINYIEDYKSDSFIIPYEKKY